MKIAIAKETASNETRVAAVPETVAKMVKAGWEVFIESGAGALAAFTDQAYEDAGAKIAVDKTSLMQSAQIILQVQAPQYKQLPSEVDLLPEKSILIAPLYPAFNPDLVAQLQKKNITAFALDSLPRIARAQSMDILSSMSNISGYKSVILAANYLAKFFPMLMTAAGTIPPAKVIVIGAGVAGLQAIATARRLGAVVMAFDTRPQVEEQVKSLGAEFVSLETKHEAETAGGYAAEQTAAFYQQEQAIIAKYSKDADVIITTALIPGKRAPILITEEMVHNMRPGSVIVDLAIDQQGNCVLSEAGKVVNKSGVTIVGLLNMPAQVAIHASELYARNIYNFLKYIMPQIEAAQYDSSDEIIKKCLITHAGEILQTAS